MDKTATPEAGDGLPGIPAGRESASAHADIGGRHANAPPAAAARRLSVWWALLKSTATKLFSLFTALIFALLVLAIVQETSRDVVMIRPIAIPKALADEGYTSSGVTQLLLSQIALINDQNQVKAVNRAYLKKSRLFGTELGELDVQLPGLGVSLRTALAFLRSLFGTGQTEIGGEIIANDASHLVLELRVNTQDRQFSETESSDIVSGLGNDRTSLEKLLRQASIQIVHDLDPYALAVYYLDKQKDRTELPEVLQYCEDVDPSCKRWSALLRGLVARDDRDLDEAENSFQDVIGETRYPADSWPAYRAAYQYWAIVMLEQSARSRGRSKGQEYSAAMNMFGRAIWLLEHHGQTMDSYDEFLVGHIYELGYGANPQNRPDCQQAATWYRRAAASGSALALNSLGDLYNPQKPRICDGVLTQSYKDARYWYERAAAGGQVYAQRSLGEMDRHGLGLSKADPHRAIYYLREAAERDDVAALIDLGQIYRDSLGAYPDWIEVDLTKACAWFDLADEAQGKSASGTASCGGGLMRIHRDNPDYARVNRLVREWNLGRHTGLESDRLSE